MSHSIAFLYVKTNVRFVETVVFIGTITSCRKWIGSSLEIILGYVYLYIISPYTLLGKAYLQRAYSNEAIYLPGLSKAIPLILIQSFKALIENINNIDVIWLVTVLLNIFARGTLVGSECESVYPRTDGSLNARTYQIKSFVTEFVT